MKANCTTHAAIGALMLPVFAALFLSFAPAASVQAQVAPAAADSAHGVPLSRMPTGAERWRLLKKEIASPGFAFESFAGGGITHLLDEPEAWRGDVWGYGVRVASTAGGALIYLGTEHGLAAALNTDIRYKPLKRGSIGRRIRYAFWEGVTVRTEGGGRLPNVPAAGGIFVADLAQNRWETGDFSFGTAGLGVAIALGFEFAENLFREF